MIAVVPVYIFLNKRNLVPIVRPWYSFARISKPVNFETFIVKNLLTVSTPSKTINSEIGIFILFGLAFTYWLNNDFHGNHEGLLRFQAFSDGFSE